MAFFAGDLKEITINHETEGSVTLQTKAGETATYDLGGARTVEVAVTGQGKSIRKINAVPWSVEVPIAWDMLSGEELQVLGRMAASPLEATYTFGNINGSVFRALGCPVGDLKADTQNSTIPTTFSGGGELKKVA